ncbi:MAG: flagellar biosynthetic protein FliO [Bythopirellula sp.]|nr:flagellar biosynthetic protein FliO [Bythopirellula sp.]
MIVWRILVRSICLLAMLGMGCTELRAQEATEPQVLFSYDRREIASSVNPNSEAAKTQATEVATQNRQAQEAPPAPVPKTLIQHDAAFAPATHVEEPIAQQPARDSRRLAPLARQELSPGEQLEKTPRVGLPFEIPYIDSLGTAGTGLVLVVGLFLLCVSLMRRSGPSPSAPLPHDAVAVLGRVPLTPKQFAHLLQVGNKLVLVSITGDRTDTITEVTEPAEVDRLLTLCMKGSKQSSSVEFQRMLSQMAKEPARGFLGRETATTPSRMARG